MAQGRNVNQGGPIQRTGEREEPSALARPVRSGDPFSLLHERMDRIFRDFLGEDFGSMAGFGGSMLPQASGAAGTWNVWPTIDVSYDPERVHVSADLPGMEEKDIHVEMDRGRLVLWGEKKTEKDEKGRNWSRRERSFGSFERAVALPDDVVPDKAEARFRSGVLTIDIPRQIDERNRPRQIPIQGS